MRYVAPKYRDQNKITTSQSGLAWVASQSTIVPVSITIVVKVVSVSCGLLVARGKGDNPCLISCPGRGLTSYSISDGRIVTAILGQNVSLSWTFSIIKNDAVYILHNESPIHRFFPKSNSSVPRRPPQRGVITVYCTLPENITVTIHFLDLTENDAGTYRVIRQWDSTDLDNLVELQTIGITYYTPMATTQKETTQKETSEGIDDCTTAIQSQKVITEGINHYKTTAMTSEVDAEAFPSKSHLLYIVLGMGGILAVAFIACLQHKIRLCLRTDRISNGNRVTKSIKDDGAETIQEDNLSGHYWTIVSNPRGEQCTAIEMNLEPHSESQLITQTMVHIDNESEDILRPRNIMRKEELDGYLNPVHSIPIELNDYIHPVHSDPVNAISAPNQYIEIL